MPECPALQDSALRGIQKAKHAGMTVSFLYKMRKRVRHDERVSPKYGGLLPPKNLIILVQ